ncbi:hypothetical protein [Tropicimonas sediminicola]|uniref:Uncharacterized protein n=1 Tax=Tropicimonas sediminicola TaxID=1031541 RepID=A0A239IPR1_9RHOB|nr:hypothetical protein [Tropicimonas sediminicola]SNS95766.1 hypothetical protein SAMN05421757_104501 [Tropicimonas sediminicola]
MVGRMAGVLAWICWVAALLTVLFGFSLPDPEAGLAALGLWVAVVLMASPFLIAGTVLSLISAMLRRRALRREASARA